VYGKIFSGITLIITVANPGFPNFVIGGLTGPSGSDAFCGDSTINSNWPTMTCLAEYSILGYLEASSAGPNLKATQMSGLVASDGVDDPDVGINFVRQTTQSTAKSSRILGGAAFNTAVAGGSTAAEGCDGPFPTPGTYVCTVEQSLYNVIRDFFEDTGAATSWGWGVNGSAPLNYLEIEDVDITYANTHATPVAVITSESPAASQSSMTAQDILSLANQGLNQISEQPLAVPAASLSITETHSGNFFQGQAGATYTVTVPNGASGVATVGLVTVIDTIPTGLTLVSMSGNGWACSGNVCTRSDVLNPNSSYPPISVTVNVASSAPSQATNQVTVSGGGSASASAFDFTSIAGVCDLKQNGNINIADVQLIINEALGVTPAVNALNGDGVVNVADVQIEINAVISLGCEAR